jgi:hypothetical protein
MLFVYAFHEHRHFILNFMHNTCSWLSCTILVALQQCWSKTLEALGLVNSSMYLVTNHATIFVIHALNDIGIQRLTKAHNKRTKGQDFTTNFEVC